MSRSIKLFLGIGLAIILGPEVLYTLLLSTPDGARLQWPEPGSRIGRAFEASGDAWLAPDAGAIASISVIARKRAGAAPIELQFPAERFVVRDRGRPLFSLPWWKAEISLPEDGSWTLVCVATGAESRQVRSAERAIEVDGPRGPSGFATWSPEHLVALAIVAIASIGAGIVAGRGGSAWLRKAAPFLAVALWLNESAYQAYWFWAGAWTIPRDLMLQMCGLAILGIPFCLFMPEGKARRYLAELLYFWGLGGAVQALLSPDIGASGFPSYKYFSFFVSHGLIVVSVSAIAGARVARIDFRALLRALAATNAIMLPIYLVDLALARVPPYVPGNYFVLGYPPPTGSPVDLMAAVFGPAPRYVVGLELMGIAVFLLLWLPWAAARRLGWGGGAAD